MSNDKTEATGYWGELPRRTPMETLAAHGAPPEPPIGHATGDTAERPYVTPGTPPWGSLYQDLGHKPRPSWRDNLAAVNPGVKYPVIGALIVTLITVVAVVVLSLLGQ